MSDEPGARARAAPARPPAAGRAGAGRALHVAAVGPRRRADAGARRPGRPPVLERPLGRLLRFCYL